MTHSANNYVVNDYFQVHGSTWNGWHASHATTPMGAPGAPISPSSTEDFDEAVDASPWSVGSPISPYEQALRVHSETYGTLPSSVESSFCPQPGVYVATDLWSSPESSCALNTYDFTLSALQRSQLEDKWNPAHCQPHQFASRVTQAPTAIKLQAPPQKHVPSQPQVPEKPDFMKHRKAASTSTIVTPPTSTPSESNRPACRRSKLSHDLVERRYREGVNQRIAELAEHLSRAYPNALPKATKSTVLTCAKDRISQLENRNAQLEHEVALMRRRLEMVGHSAAPMVQSDRDRTAMSGW
ncbi:hypothetical protein B0A49_09190 [Cryomyces minteri]|uniref:BHLH domain-containing protein n=1 Tax=Cryomyces minteri TaxID=331657 RepID=A0A4U0WN66_9PEZI|nr:hypothetical protein B0A49_09190 [Cryomyces minteri]